MTPAMNDSTLDLTPLESPDVAATGVSALALSRGVAVDRIFTGSVLTLSGAGLGVGASLLLGSPPPLLAAGLLTLACFGLMGTGLALIGRAAKHLWRFGETGGALFLAALGGLGVSSLVFVVPMLAVVFGVPGLAWESLAVMGYMGMALSASLAVFLVLGALLRWTIDSLRGGIEDA